jgi:hypothetical protein
MCTRNQTWFAGKSMVDVLIDTEILRGFPIAMVDHRRVPYMNGRMTVQNVRLFDVKSRVPGFL